MEKALERERGKLKSPFKNQFKKVTTLFYLTLKPCFQKESYALVEIKVLSMVAAHNLWTYSNNT